MIILVLGALSRFLEQPVQVIYLLIFYVNIFHHINIGGKSLYISHIIWEITFDEGIFHILI